MRPARSMARRVLREWDDKQSTTSRARARPGVRLVRCHHARGETTSARGEPSDRSRPPRSRRSHTCAIGWLAGRGAVAVLALDSYLVNHGVYCRLEPLRHIFSWASWPRRNSRSPRRGKPRGEALKIGPTRTITSARCVSHTFAPEDARFASWGVGVGRWRIRKPPA
jgi:hypothetical protein